MEEYNIHLPSKCTICNNMLHTSNEIQTHKCFSTCNNIFLTENGDLIPQFGVLTPFAASKKWRYLRDSYMRIRNEQIKKKSGSAATKLVRWKWYTHLLFLQDTQDYRSTTSNVSSSDNESVVTNEIEQTHPILKRRKKSDDDNMLQRVAAMMKESINVNVTSSETQLETPKKLSDKSDNINNILAIINNLLHDMPETVGFPFALKLLHLTTEKENEYRKK